MKQIKLTLCIVAKDRVEQFRELCNHLKELLSKVDWIVHIYDNSDTNVFNEKSKILSDLLRAQQRFSTVKIKHIPDFIDCRNACVKECTTPWMMILDDDDKIDLESLNKLLTMKCFDDEYLSTNNIDFVSFAMRKESEHLPFDYSMRIVKDKENELSQFDDYENSKLTKVYTRNAGNLYRVRKLSSCMKWMYVGCDDILPITDLYLSARNVLRVNAPIQIYSSQNTVGRVKTKEQVRRVELGMHDSYIRLYSKHNTLSDSKVIIKSIQNSIKQLAHFDNYDAIDLKNLCKEIENNNDHIKSQN